jgi:hypothetical protein
MEFMKQVFPRLVSPFTPQPGGASVSARFTDARRLLGERFDEADCKQRVETPKKEGNEESKE